MKAIILAAGVASRLRPLTNNTPKCLLSIGNRTLLGRTIDALRINGVDEFTIVTGYLNHLIESFIEESYPDLNVRFIHNHLYNSTNNIFSLWLARPEADGKSILLLDSDILFDADIVKSLLESEHPTCLAVNRHDLSDEEMKVVIDDDNRIVEISKTCAPEHAFGESIGIEKMDPCFTSSLYKELDIMMNREQSTNIFYEAAFERIIEQGMSLFAVDTTHFFSMELDTVEDFNDAINKIPQNLL